MKREDIFELVRSEIFAVLPSLRSRDIRIEDNLKDLGADSMDRAEIVQQSMRRLQIRIPPVELAAVQNLCGLVDLFEAWVARTREPSQ